VVSVDVTERKSRRALKGNECAAYFENDEKQQRAAELSLANTELFFKTNKEKACSRVNQCQQ
jgi:hypothetical protein